MSDTNNYYGGGVPMMGYGCGAGGCGSVVELLVVFLLFGMFGWGGNGFGGRGGCEQADATAYKTAQAITQDATNSKVAETLFGTNQILGQTGGIIQQVQRTSDRVQDMGHQIDVGLGQLGYNMAMQGVNNYNGLSNQINDLRFQQQQSTGHLENMVNNRFCETNRHIENSTAAILNRMNQAEMEKLRAENLELKGRISQDAQTATLLAGRGCFGAAYAAPGCCNPCGEIVQPIVTALQGISAQLTNLQTSVNKIPTTAV